MEQRKLTILFGTQTGTAEEVAWRISRDSNRRYIQARVISLENFDAV